MIVGSISVFATVAATSITYTPTWTKDNGDSITNVSEAIDELYNRSRSYGLEYVDTIKGGKNETSSSSQVTISKELDAGNYLVIVVRSSANSNATGNTTNATTPEPLGTLSGYISINSLLNTNYGQYYRASGNYPNQYVYMGIVTMGDNGTLTETFPSNTASTNLQMIIFKIR